MRDDRLRVTPEEGHTFHPLGETLRREPAVRRERIHQVELLADETGIMLAEATRDRERHEAIRTDATYVHEFSVTGTDGRWYSYSHFDPSPRTSR